MRFCLREGGQVGKTTYRTEVHGPISDVGKIMGKQHICCADREKKRNDIAGAIEGCRSDIMTGGEMLELHRQFNVHANRHESELEGALRVDIRGRCSSLIRVLFFPFILSKVL